MFVYILGLSAVKPEKEESKSLVEEESESKSKARAKLNIALENAENRYQ